jgi:hypothetical protein
MPSATLFQTLCSPLKAALLLTALLSVVAGPGFAQSAVVERIDVLRSGIFEADILNRRGEDAGPVDVRNTLANVRLVGETANVPLRHCVTFGFEYTIVGSPRGAEVSLRMITRFPPPGLRNPHTGRLSRAIETSMPRLLGRRHIRAYSLEHGWELLAGVWTLEIWQGRQMLATRSFTLTGRCEGDCRRQDDHDHCIAPPISSLPDAKSSVNETIRLAPGNPFACGAGLAGRRMMSMSRSSAVAWREAGRSSSRSDASSSGARCRAAKRQDGARPASG